MTKFESCVVICGEQACGREFVVPFHNVHLIVIQNRGETDQEALVFAPVHKEPACPREDCGRTIASTAMNYAAEIEYLASRVDPSIVSEL